MSATAEPLILHLTDDAGARTIESRDLTLAAGRAETAQLRLTAPRVSREHGRFLRRTDGWYYEDLASRHGTLLNGRAVPAHTPAVLHDGDRLELGDAIVTVGAEAPVAPVPAAAAVAVASYDVEHASVRTDGNGPASVVSSDAMAHRVARAIAREAAGAGDIARIRPMRGTISTGVVRVGRALDNDVVVPDQYVSSYHLTAWPADGGLAIKDLDSRNGTFADGARISLKIVPRDATIRLGPAATLRAADLLARAGAAPGPSWFSEHATAAEPLLAGEGLTRVVDGDRPILRDVDICVRCGQFVAVVGASGAGKSTLATILNGYTTPDAGTLAVARNTAGDAEIGYMPQEDIIHRELPLRDAIVLSAMLRFPPGTARAAVEVRADEVLRDLGLTEHAATLVGRLSGGQRKRAGMALELMTRPSLLILDEVTSGLDPATERKLMHLLRGLADAGIGIVLVTHATANLALCDTVAVLAPGGYLVFWGTPDEARGYFETDTFDQVYDKLEAEVTPEAWRERFARSPRMGALRRDVAEGRRVLEDAALHQSAPPAAGERRGWQLRCLVARYTRTLTADRRGLLFLLLQVPALLLLARLILLRDGDVLFDQTLPTSGLQLLFIIALVMIWAGAFNAGREICKERAIWQRERHLGVDPWAYVGSKLVVLGGLCLVQTAIMTALVALFWRLPGGSGALAGVAAGGFLAALSGVAAGLAVSALVRTPDQAMALLPLVTIPQLMFGGLLKSVEAMGGAGAAITSVISARWAFSALGNATDRRSYLPSGDEFRAQMEIPWAASLGAMLVLVLVLTLLTVLLVGRDGSAHPARDRKGG